jgi:ABC-2 type transport system permease protein
MSPSLSPILALAAKDLRLLLRDRMGFFFTFFFPLLVALFFGTVFKSAGGDDDAPSRIRIAIIDEDATDASRELGADLAGAAEFVALPIPTLDDATDNLAGIIRIPKGYGEASERLFYGDPATLHVITDPSRGPESQMLQGILTKHAYRRFQQAFSDPDLGRQSARTALDAVRSSTDMDPKARAALESFLPRLDQFLTDIPAAGEGDSDGGAFSGMAGWEPVRIEASTVQRQTRGGSARPSSAYAISFAQGTLWGIIGCTLSLGLSLVTERTRGTLIRLRMAPIARWHILAGKSAACFLVMGAIAAVLLSIAAGLGARPTSVPLLVLAVLATAICFVGMMMLVSVLGRTEQAAAGLGWAVMLIFMMLGGGMIPQFLLPGWMQSLGSISPAKWAILALDGALWRGYSLAEMLRPCLILVIIGLATFTAGASLFSRADRA